MPLHRLVWIAWNGEIQDNFQINHINDIATDISLNNLYLDTQKENINDCINNGHRVGNIFSLTVLDKFSNMVYKFCPANNFFNFCGHSCENGGIKRVISRKWFKERFIVLEYKRILNNNEYRKV